MLLDSARFLVFGKDSVARPGKVFWPEVRDTVARSGKVFWPEVRDTVARSGKVF